MANDIRQKKLSADILKYVTLILQREIKNEILHNISIHEVKLSSDLSNAKIYYSPLIVSKKDIVVEKLEQYSKEIRTKLAGKLTIYRCPTLTFIYDDTLDNANKIENIIKKINHKD